MSQISPSTIRSREPSDDRLVFYATDRPALRDLGFWGRACIHPKQLPVVAEVFRPTEAELASARMILDAVAVSGGAATTADGTMIDEAVGCQGPPSAQAGGRRSLTFKR